MADFIITHVADNATLTVSLRNKPYTIPNTDPKYLAMVTAIKEGKTEEELLAILQEDSQRVEAAISVTEGFTYRDGVVYYDDVPLNTVLGEYMVSLVRDGFPLDGLIAFVKNLFLNPSYRAVSELYPFLRKGNNALTSDGCFLAYKRVKANYFDCHSGEVLNKPAALLTAEELASLPRKAGRVTTALNENGVVVVQMPRNAVNEDSSETCSFGLHVCSFDYLSCFGGERVLVCKINPRDVVSIPADYHSTKMRVCAYEVVAELEELYQDTLGSRSLAANPFSPEEGTFAVQLRDSADDEWATDATFVHFADAEAHYMGFVDGDVSARLFNLATNQSLREYEYEALPDEDASSSYHIEKLLKDGSSELVVEDVPPDEWEDLLGEAVRDAVVDNAFGDVQSIRAVRMVNDTVVEVLRSVVFGA